MSEHGLNNFIEMLDTDNDEQDLFFGEVLAQREQVARDLAAEALALDELEDAPMDPYEKALAAETPQRRKLKRDLEREALIRLETAARTPADYQYIVSWWDRLDANRERRERYREVLRSNDTLPLETGEAPDIIDTCVPSGDASLNIDGIETGPASSIISMFLINTVVSEAIRIVTSHGKRPYVFQSQNVDGFDNNAIYEHFKGRIKHF